MENATNNNFDLSSSSLLRMAWSNTCDVPTTYL